MTFLQGHRLGPQFSTVNRFKGEVSMAILKKFPMFVLVLLAILPFNSVFAQDDSKVVEQEHCPPVTDKDFSASPIHTNGCFWYKQNEAVSFWMEGSLYSA